MVKQQWTKRRNTENLRELFYMQNIQENITKTFCEIVHGQNISGDCRNRLEVLSGEDIITSHWSLHSIICINHYSE